MAGCSATLPSVERDFSEFIPQPELAKVYPTSFDFAEKNFPENCDWKDFVRVVDGDTIVVGDDERVRFVGIDTPESKHHDKPIQRGALEASDMTKSFIAESEKVCLIYDRQGDRYDTYGRTLAYIFTEEGTDINAELLLSGHARGYFGFPFSRRLEFEAYQQTAKNSSLGLWGDSF